MLKNDILLAMCDDEFQNILENDKVIQGLQKEKFNAHDEYWQLMTVFSAKNELEGVLLNPITVGMWCFLYSIKNPYVIGGKKEEKDTDVFMYLLHTGFDGLKQSLYEDAKDFCKKHELSYIQAQLYLLQMIALAFRPLEMISTTGVKHSGDGVHYNLQWLTGIISVVHEQTGEDKYAIMYRMSLLQSFYYVINHLKKGDIHNRIRRKNSDEINAEIYKRTMELGQIYYNTKYK